MLFCHEGGCTSVSRSPLLSFFWCVPSSRVPAPAARGASDHRQGGERSRATTPVGKWSTHPFLMPNQHPCDVKAGELSTTFIWILTTFSLFVKHCDKVTFCLGETAYQTFHGEERRPKAHIFFSKIKRHRDRSLFGCRWADWQNSPCRGWRRSYQLRSRSQQIRLGFCSRSVRELGIKDWTTRPTWDLELHDADGFLSPKWGKIKTTRARIFKTWLRASWLLLSTMSERGMRWGCYTVEKTHCLQGYPRDAAWKTWYRTRIGRNDLNPKKEI